MGFLLTWTKQVAELTSNFAIWQRGVSMINWIMPNLFFGQAAQRIVH